MSFRTRFYVEPALQSKIIVFTLILVLTCLLITHLFYAYVINNTMNSAIKDNSEILAQAPMLVLHTIQVNMYTALGVVVLISALVSCLAAIYFSHKIAGPVYRLKKHIQQCAEKGRLEEIHFRDNDYLQDLALEINKFAEKTNN